MRFPGLGQGGGIRAERLPRAGEPTGGAAMPPGEGRLGAAGRKRRRPGPIRGSPAVGRGLPGQTAGRTPPRRTKQRELRSWPVRPTRPTGERESGPARGEIRGGCPPCRSVRPAAPAGPRGGRLRDSGAMGRRRRGPLGAVGEGRFGQAALEQA